MELLACILDGASIRRILAHLDLATELEPPRPCARLPSADLWRDDVATPQPSSVR